jgi:hypothetical protein
MQGYYSCIGGKPKNFFCIRALEFLDRDPFSPLECQYEVILSTINGTPTNYYASTHGTNMGKSFPESFEYNACPTIYVLL